MSIQPDKLTARPLTKVLFIGVDAADKDLIMRWVKDGSLPTFKSLFEKAAWGLTENPMGFFVGAVWPSFYTAQSPARHSRYCYSQLKNGTYDHVEVKPTDVKAKPFWEVLTRAGKRVAIIDVPKTYLVPGLNGFHVIDWGTHDRDYSFDAWPQEIKQEIEEQIGEHPIKGCDAYRTTPGEFDSFRAGLISGVQKKEELIRHYLQQGGWDLFLSVFGESHCVGHQCWHLYDATHPQHNAEVAEAVGNPIKDVYAAIDTSIGRLLESVDEETAVFVLASHGMAAHYDGCFLLDDLLFRLETSWVPPSRRAALDYVLKIGRKVPLSWRRMLRPVKTTAKSVGGAAAVAQDVLWARHCFAIANNDAYGAIRINLVGREPYGKIRPGAEYDALCEKLTEQLLEVVNLGSGEKLVRNVIPTREVYKEPNDDLPDLLVEWNRDHPITRVFSPRIGTLEKTFEGNRTGDHRANGLFFATGPGIRAGQVPAQSVMNFAPTFASLLDVELPDSEGAPIAELQR